MSDVPTAKHDSNVVMGILKPGNIVCTFPFFNHCFPACLRVLAHVYHHAVDGVVENEAGNARGDRCPAIGALQLAQHPLNDAVVAERVRTTQ